MIVTNIKNSTAAGMVIYQKIGKALLLTLLLGMATIAKAQTNAERPGLFYAVTGNGLRDTSWLFGTYHLVNSGYLDDKLGIQSAFNRAKGVVVEIVMDEAGMKAAQNKGMMQGQTAQQLLGQSFSDSLDAELKKEMGIGLAAMNQLKPMNIMLGLTITYTMKQSGSLLQQYKGQPIDLSFVQEAKKMSKPVHPLETVEQQMDVLFANLTEAEQAWQLKLFLRNKTSVQQSINELLAAWLRQDAVALYRLYEESRQLYATSATFDQALNKDRNNRWMLQLPGLLAQGPQFVAVGALHLIGPDGLVSQLQQKGYTVIPIKP